MNNSVGEDGDWGGVPLGVACTTAHVSGREQTAF